MASFQSGAIDGASVCGKYTWTCKPYYTAWAKRDAAGAPVSQRISGVGEVELISGRIMSALLSAPEARAEE
jgi:hypothetical protein